MLKIFSTLMSGERRIPKTIFEIVKNYLKQNNAEGRAAVN